MKKYILLSVLVGLLFIGNVANAQTSALESQAGITPDSSFYFLDRLVENIQEFFTFNKEAKARLQIKLASERIAEIRILVEKKGPEAKGIDKAKKLLIGNVAYAAEIVQKVKTSGKNVTKLAKELNDQFDGQERLLVKTFQEAQKTLKENRLSTVQNLIEQARQSGNTKELSNLKKQEQGLMNEDNALKKKENEIKVQFHVEKQKIEKELSDKDHKEAIDHEREVEEIDKEIEKKDNEVEGRDNESNQENANQSSEGGGEGE